MATSNVRILGRNFKVVQEADGKLAGYCDRKAGIIGIDPEQDEFGLKDTFLHEIMHGILWQQGYDHKYPLEESFVRPLATGLITVFQDNPDLAKWLIKHIKEKP